MAIAGWMLGSFVCGKLNLFIKSRGIFTVTNALLHIFLGAVENLGRKFRVTFFVKNCASQFYLIGFSIHTWSTFCREYSLRNAAGGCKCRPWNNRKR